MSKPLHKLERGAKFKLADEAEISFPPLVEELGLTDHQEEEMYNAVYNFIKVDGMYAQVEIEINELHEILSNAFDNEATFFCIPAATEVEPVNDGSVAEAG